MNKNEILIFDIGKVGKYEEEFDEFIQLLIKTIKEIRHKLYQSMLKKLKLFFNYVVEPIP